MDHGTTRTALGAAIAVLLLLGACGKKGDLERPQPVQPAQEETEQPPTSN
ncbi:MAG: lipoprotein [Pseudomonadota bacterium]